EAVAMPHLPSSDRARAHLLLAEAQHRRDDDLAAAHRRAALEELRRLGDRRGIASLLLESASTDAHDTLTAKRWLLEAQELARQVEWEEGRLRIKVALEPLTVDA